MPKQLDMPAVTSVMLEELDARIADGLGHELPVPFYYIAAWQRCSAMSCEAAHSPQLPRAAHPPP